MNNLSTASFALATALATVATDTQASILAAVNVALAPVGLVLRRQASKRVLARRLANLATEVRAMIDALPAEQAAEIATEERTEAPAPVVEAAPVVTEEPAPVSGVTELPPVDKAERADVCLKTIAAQGSLTAHDAAKLLRLQGTFAPQAAVAALTSLVRRGLAVKIHLTDGTATWRLPEAASAAA
jgi:hypothetical protein